MKLDILAFGSHPDDMELSCSGTLLIHIKQGKKIGIVDLTRGELGTRGTPEIREQEAKDASVILGISVRENLGMQDGFFLPDQKNLLSIVKIIRKYQPEIIISNARSDRHPDHARGSSIVSHAAFLSGLIKIETNDQDKKQSNWRTNAIYHVIQDQYIKPDFVVDITSVWEEKMNAIKAFKSQFYNPGSKEPSTPISSEEFLGFLEARARELGRPARMKYAEGFTVERTPGVNSLFDLI